MDSKPEYKPTMQQFMISTNVFAYALQPGDATAYTFMLVQPRHYDAISAYMPEDEQYRDEWMRSSFNAMQHLFPGNGDGLDYVQLIITMPSTQCVLNIHKERFLDKFEELPAFLGYLIGKARSGDPYTIVACFLAARVLFLKPDNFTEACKEMLRTPEMFKLIHKKP